MNDWAAVRDEFPVLRDWTYLNAATFGPVATRTLRAAQTQLERRNLGPGLDFLSWYDEADQVRLNAARLIGASLDDIGFLPNAGIGLSWLLNGLDWRPGDQVLGLEDEFPNNLYSPMMLERFGVEFVAAPGGGDFSLDALLERINERTRLVLLSAVSYSTGLRPPLAEIGQAAREAGAILAVDATQGMGAIEIDVEAQSIDAIICHCYKSMLCPAGIGFLYLSLDARRAVRPTVFSWRSHQDWRNVDHLHHGAPELPEEAARYEGGVLNFAGVAALGAMLDWLHELGPSEVYEQIERIVARTRQILNECGGELRSSPDFDSPIVTAKFPGVDASRLAVELRNRNIAVAARKGRLRVSPHFYNSEQDLERLRAALKEIL